MATKPLPPERLAALMRAELTASIVRASSQLSVMGLVHVLQAVDDEIAKGAGKYVGAVAPKVTRKRRAGLGNVIVLFPRAARSGA